MPWEAKNVTSDSSESKNVPIFFLYGERARDLVPPRKGALSSFRFLSRYELA